MNREDITALFDRRADAWARHDHEALAASHSEDAVAESPLLGRLVGRRRINESYAAWFTAFKDLTVTRLHLLIDGNQAAEFFSLRGTQSAPFHGVPATARRVNFNVAWLYTIGPEGLIVHDQRVYDVTGMLVQLGLLKAKPVASAVQADTDH